MVDEPSAPLTAQQTIRMKEGACIELPISDLELLDRVRRRAESFGMTLDAAMKQALSMFLMHR